MYVDGQVNESSNLRATGWWAVWWLPSWTRQNVQFLQQAIDRRRIHPGTTPGDGPHPWQRHRQMPWPRICKKIKTGHTTHVSYHSQPGTSPASNQQLWKNRPFWKSLPSDRNPLLSPIIYQFPRHTSLSRTLTPSHSILPQGSAKTPKPDSGVCQRPRWTYCYYPKGNYLSKKDVHIYPSVIGHCTNPGPPATLTISQTSTESQTEAEFPTDKYVRRKIPNLTDAQPFCVTAMLTGISWTVTEPTEPGYPHVCWPLQVEQVCPSRTLPRSSLQPNTACPLDEKLTTFITPFGRFMYRRARTLQPQNGWGFSRINKHKKDCGWRHCIWRKQTTTCATRSRDTSSMRGQRNIT